jgi:hypothetical protein
MFVEIIGHNKMASQTTMQHTDFALPSQFDFANGRNFDSFLKIFHS